jgi:hypothetical protein
LGKSSVLVELAAILGHKARGVVCPGLYTEGRKSAVCWLDLARAGHDAAGHSEAKALARELPGYTGMTGQARIDLRDEKLVRYGKWEFSREALACADEACLRAIEDPSARLAIVDELGPLELSYGQGYVRTLQRLDELFGARPAATHGPGDGGGRANKAVIVALRPDLAPLLAERWRGSYLFELSKDNRAGAAAALAARISSWL